MNKAIILTQALNLIFIAVLPQVFFKRDGRFNLMWWLTGLPFGVAGLFLAGTQMGIFTPVLALDGVAGISAGLIGLTLSICSIALMAFTLGTHQKRIALWHQNNDAPEHIVTHGAYKYVRHPFYSAFLLGLLGVALHIPHIISAALFVYALLLLTFTARREENFLSSSEFGDDYRAYKNVTGRFMPKWGARHA